MASNQMRRWKQNSRMARAIRALLENTTIEKAAEATGVSHVTLWRWMQQEEFRERLSLARRQAFSQCVGRLQQAGSAAVTTLLRVMTDQAAPHASRVRAAHSVLDHATKAIELDDIEIRLARLEQFAEKPRDSHED